jgi:hypothetical protein
MTAQLNSPITDLAWSLGSRLAAATENGRVVAFDASTSV